MKDGVFDFPLDIFLVFDVLFDDVERRSTHCGDEIGARPQGGEPGAKRRELAAQEMSAAAFDQLDEQIDPVLRMHLAQQMNVVGHDFQLDDCYISLGCSLTNYFF